MSLPGQVLQGILARGALVLLRVYLGTIFLVAVLPKLQQDFTPHLTGYIQQVSLECYHSHVPPDLMKLLEGKDVMVGVIDVASDVVETPEQVADTIGKALQFVPKDRLFPCTNCGLAPMRREVALAKLQALGAGAALARERYR